MADANTKSWRIIDVLNWARDYLRKRGVEAPQIEAEWMLRDVLNLSRLQVYLQHERPLTASELASFKQLLLSRIAGKPIQYVLGYTEFMGLKLEVNAKVLIPRPETELIVEKVIQQAGNKRKGKISILDLGTGSGCIAIALAKAFPRAAIVALDISSPALEVASRNAERHNVLRQITFLERDMLTDSCGDRQFNIIVSNPPYVAGEWYRKLPAVVKENEPRLALDPGEDELIHYRRLAELAASHLKRDGLLAVEIGGDYQEVAVREVFRSGGLDPIETLKDYSGQSRGIFARWKQC